LRRRAFVQGAISLAAAACARPARVPEGELELEEATIPELRAWVDARPHGARELVDRYLARVASIDRSGPTLKSVVELNPDARAIAERLDADRGRRGPLHGIPILLKDNIDTGDRMLTTAGSLALTGAPAHADAPIVARLRAAGAIILGKTNLTEWANIRDRRATSGWSARGGFTRNPYVLDRNPSGSSSGSAVAVSANLAAVAIGTETVGSIISPSSICGVVGLKPTAGAVPHAGIVPISHTQDTPGPIARSVMDAAIVHSVLTGDPLPNAENLRGVRIGVRRALEWLTAEVTRTFDQALDVFRGLGVELVDGLEFPADKLLGDPLLELLLVELQSDLANYLATRRLPVRTLEDIVRFNESHRDAEMPWFGQDLFVEAMKKGEGSASRDLVAKCRKLARDEGLDEAFSKHRLDALVAPSTGLAWVTDPVTGDNFTGSSARLPAVAGYPNVTVPCGTVHELPLGLSFVGPPRSEPRLLGIALAYEKATKHRRSPRYLRTLS
jgi:amidase